MYCKNYLKRRKRLARLLTAMLYEGRNSKHNLTWIHEHYGKYLFGVDLDTFRFYLDEEDSPDDADIPCYIVVGLWLMVNVPHTVYDLPFMLRRRIGGTVAAGMWRMCRARGKAER